MRDCQWLFLRCDAYVAQKRLQQILMWSRDDMRADQFADFAGSFRSCVHRGFDATDVALCQYGDQPAADRNGFHQTDIRGLDHSVAGLDAADITARFDHSYCFTHNLVDGFLVES